MNKFEEKKKMLSLEKIELGGKHLCFEIFY